MEAADAVIEVIGQDYAIVPIEPTEAMDDAGADELPYYKWRAILQAAKGETK